MALLLPAVDWVSSAIAEAALQRSACPNESRRLCEPLLGYALGLGATEEKR
jgi:hypothetical protein